MNDRVSPASGFVMLPLLAAVIPMVLIVAAFTSTMNGRTDDLMSEFDAERALLAAEAGIDDALYNGRIGALVDGDNYQRTLAGDLQFEVEPTYLQTDGLDNDNDGNIDEDDEDVFQIIVTGTYRDRTRRVAAYLGPVPLLPTLNSAMTAMNSNVTIDLRGSSLLTGHDTNFDGTPGPAPSQYGMTTVPPGTVADLRSELSGSEENRVDGLGGPPSLGMSSPIDIDTLVSTLQNIADVVLTSDRYSADTFGTVFAPEISYRDGNVRFSGNCSGAGVLVVTGDLKLTGTMNYYGVIVVLGDFESSAGTAEVYGGIVQGPTGNLIEGRGTLRVFYSSRGIDLANSTSGRYVSYNGWQELAR